MAKKPKEKEDSSPAITRIRKLYGDGVVVNGMDIIDTPREVISVSPRMDAGLGGGILVGTLITMAGEAGCGKTTTALHIAAKCQKLSKKVFYISTEHRLYSINFKGVQGLDPGKIEVVQACKGRILNAQEFLMAVEIVLREESNALVIVDSFSVLSEADEMNAEDYTKAVSPGGANRVVARWCRRMAPIIPINNNIVIGMFHIHAAIGDKFRKWTSTMPTKIEFARSTGLYCTGTKAIQGDKGQIGQKVFWNVERTPLGPPGKVESIIRYGTGVDEVMEAIEWAKDVALLTQNGSWIDLTFMGGETPKKLQGLENVRDYLVENPKDYEVLLERLRYFSDES